MPSGRSRSAAAEYKYDVFISYSHADEEWVTGTLLPHLETKGLKVCIDFRDFTAGRPAILNMQDAAKGSRHTVVVLSPRWETSEWGLLETLLTRTDDPAGLRRRTVPVMIEDCAPPELLSVLTWVDFTRADREEIAWTQLLGAVESPQAPSQSRLGRVGNRLGTESEETLNHAPLLVGTEEKLRILGQLKPHLEPETVFEFERRILDDLFDRLS